MVDPVSVSLGTIITAGQALFGLAKNKRTPNVVELAKRTGDWNDPVALKALERKLSGPTTKARTPGAQIAVDKSRDYLRRQVTARLDEIGPGDTPPPPPPPGEEIIYPDELPGDDLPGDDLPDDEYTDDEEAYDDYLSDLEAESGVWDQPWFEQADPAGDPTEQIGDPERRQVERDLRQDVAPYAVEYYRSEFVDNRPRVPDRVPTRLPGRVGSAGAMVEGIVNLIRLGRAIWELQTESAPIPKGPGTRPKGRIETLPDLEPIKVSKARKPAVRLDETTRRALEKPTKTAPKLEPELQEIRVTKARRPPPTRGAGPKVGTTAKTTYQVGVLDALRLLELVKRKPTVRRTVIRPGDPIATPPLTGIPEIITRPSTPEAPPPQTERARVESTLAQQQGSTTRTKDKKCKPCAKESRTVCYEGFYRERKKSTTKKRWQKVDCITGKEIR